MNSEDTISRSAAIKALRQWRVAISTERAVAEIEHLPSVPPQVVHGRLAATGYDELYCEFGNCTVCGADNPMHNKYCRECGVKLDGGEDDADN